MKNRDKILLGIIGAAAAGAAGLSDGHHPAAADCPSRRCAASAARPPGWPGARPGR